MTFTLHHAIYLKVPFLICNRILNRGRGMKPRPRPKGRELRFSPFGNPHGFVPAASCGEYSDLKLMLKRRYQMSKLDQMISYLITNTSLPERYKPYKLSGNYMGFWECHITPAWLLIYRVHNGDLDLARTGTHSDLFR